jgi:hypothetical protein
VLSWPVRPALTGLRCQLDDLPSMVNGVYSMIPDEQYEATMKFRKLLSIGETLGALCHAWPGSRRGRITAVQRGIHQLTKSSSRTSSQSSLSSCRGATCRSCRFGVGVEPTC